MPSRSPGQMKRPLSSNSEHPPGNQDGRDQGKDSGDVVMSNDREVHVYSEHPDNVAVHYDHSDDTEVRNLCIPHATCITCLVNASGQT